MNGPTAAERPATRGRPRRFDRDEALATAMLAFWRDGYDGTSIARLTAEMGIAPPSLYAAFGSKSELYREALALYVRTLGRLGTDRLERARTARSGVHEVLRTAAVAFTRPGMPPGCMVGIGSLHCAGENATAERATRELRTATAETLLRRLRRAHRDGELPADADPAELTDHYCTVIAGMSVLAHDGAARDRLLAVADRAMAGWPG